MSLETSRKNEKRPRSTSDSNNSFVKNVTSKVSGLLPATIVKWFSNSSSPNTNGSAQVTEATDSSTEDEAPESPVIIQPPNKRMRYSSPENNNQSVPVETRCTSTNTESLDDLYGSINSPVIRSTFRTEKNLMSTPLSSASNESTNDTVQDNTFFKSEHSLLAVGQSTAKKRRSLFGNSNEDDSYKRSTPTYSGNMRDPYFKASLMSSPFYMGRTRYGGASSSYMSHPNIKQRNISLTEDTSNNDNVNISHSARRVMDLLEHYSSPLSEAKRIPQIPKHSADGPLNPFDICVNPYTSKVPSYKTQELHVPRLANIMTIKRRARLMDSTNAARQIAASHSSTSEFLPYVVADESDSCKGASQNKFTAKVKSRLTRPNRQQNIEMECNAANIVNLPTAVLQIDKDNLPKFKFGDSISQPFSIQTPVIIAPDSLKRTAESNKSFNSKINDTDTDKPVHVDDGDNYLFASPMKVLKESDINASTPSQFNFGSPERNIEKTPEKKTKNDNASTTISTQIGTKNEKPVVVKSSDWKCLDCWVVNKTEVINCVCCGGKKPIEIDDNDSKKCLICKVSCNQTKCDKCMNSEKKTNNNPFVANETNISPAKVSDSYKQDNVNKNDLSDKTKPIMEISSKENIESEWKCNDCWIKNKITLDKCVACGGSKPGSKPGNTINDIPPLPINNQGLAAAKETFVGETAVKETSPRETYKRSFEKIVKAKPEKWQCPICLVRNEGNRSTCACCEVPKPGSIPESHKRLFNFHQPSEITYKLGIQPKTDEDSNNQEMIDIEDSKMESETNNNILPKTPTFKFGIPETKNNDQTESSLGESKEAPKLNFTFNIHKQNTVPPAINTIFGTNKLADIMTSADTTNKLTVPQLFTPSKSEEELKNTNSMFNMPVSSQNSQIISAEPEQMSNQSSTKNELAFYNNTEISTVNSEMKTQQNTFTFSALRPTTNLFGPTSIASTSITTPLSHINPISTAMSLFPTVDSITTTAVSLFQNSDQSPKTAVSLFPKAESTTSTTVSLGITQPVFSFGSSATQNLTQVEKPKFVFSFGSNKTETPSLFKPTFGVSNDNNPPTFGVSNDNNPPTFGLSNDNNPPTFGVSNDNNPPTFGVSNDNNPLTNKFNLSNVSANVLSANPLNNSAQLNPGNTLPTGNSLTTAPPPSLFGTTVQKENMWGSNNVMFTQSTTTNTPQNPPAFTFGTSTPFNANNGTFGTSTQPAQNVFGMNQPTTSPPSMFTNQTVPNIFGTPQTTNNQMMGMFGAAKPNVTPSFGSSNPPMPTFETQQLTATPTPTFNFGSQQQQPTGIFGFGQHNQAPPQVEQQPQAPQGGMYTFGQPGGAPQLQFNMGSAPNPAGRRVFRKATRRTQR